MRPFARHLASLFFALLMVTSVPICVWAQACPVSGTPINGSITAGDPTQTDRVFRDGVPSNCNGKTYPGDFGSTSSFHFDQHTFLNNSGATVCIQISFNATTNMHSVAYLNSFNPADLSENYLGDLGVVNTPNTTQSYSVSVPNGATLVVVVNEATANGGGNYTLTLSCIAPPPPVANQPGQILISEFRLSGPAAGAGSQRDEFIELYNNTDQARTIDQLLLQAYDPNFFGPGDGADFIQSFPPGTFIPARGHFLVGDGSAYSLTGYAALNMDTLPLFNGDFFIDNEGLQIVTNDGITVLDSVGVSGSGGRPGEVVDYVEGTPIPRRTQTAPLVQYAYVRKEASGFPRDTNNNASDFALVAVDGSTFSLAAGGTTPSTLGAPGPQNLASQLHTTTGTMAMPVFDNSVSSGSAPNFVFDPTPVTNGASGTITVRRRLVNNTGGTISNVRFRIVDITTFPPPGASVADLRVLNSANLTLQTPPAQAMGGGLNSSVLASGTPIADGANIPIDFVFGIQQTGCFHFIVIAETLPGGANTIFGFGGTAGAGSGCAPTAAPASISGQVTTASGAPLPGVTMNLSGARSARTITDSQGNYRFLNVDTDNFYTVTPSLVNYHFGPQSQSFSLLANKTDATFTATRDAVISGNAIDMSGFFVRQHYLDFLGREPDEAGFNFWSDQITSCGSDATCVERRTINVSAAYFLSIESWETGGLVDGLYKASYGRAPLFNEFMPDTATVARNVIVNQTGWQEQLRSNKQQFLDAWVQRAAFRAAYDNLGNDSYVDTLISHTGVEFTAAERGALVNGLNTNALTRAEVLQQLAQNERFVKARFNEAFVRMQYFGYLRRDPDDSGFHFWLNKLNEFEGNFERAEMVKAFLVSGEYRDRFRQ